MTTIYDNDECDRPPRRSFYDEPCRWCDDGSLPVGTMPNTIGCVPACASCIMAFEEADAPEELAMTLEGADVVGCVRADEDFKAGCREGLRAYLAGDTGQPWEDVKRELDIE